MRRVIDQAFCDRARLLAAVHPLQDVAAILRVSSSQITRIKQRGWRAATHDAMRRPRPSDFQLRQSELSFRELGAHYRCGNTTLMRWFAELRAEGKARASWRGDSLRSTPRRGAIASPTAAVDRTRALLAAAGRSAR